MATLKKKQSSESFGRDSKRKIDNSPAHVKKEPSNPRPTPKQAQKIRVLIVDDHPLFRAGLHKVLELESDVEIIGEVADGETALNQVPLLKPNVILMDVSLPAMNGLQVTKELTASRANAAVIVLTAFHDDEQMLHAMRAGACAYFPKEVSPDVLIDAIRQANQGNYVINDAVLGKPQIANWLLGQFEEMSTSGAEVPEGVFQPLSTREMEILKCITKGMSNKEIARALGISRQTVKNHMTSILRKLAVNDRTQAAVYALRRGWIRLQDTR